jgi:hypothetical protein
VPFAVWELIAVCIGVALLVSVKLLGGVVAAGNEVLEATEDGDPETEYWALVENSTLLVLVANVVDDVTEDVAEMKVPAAVPSNVGVKSVVDVSGGLESGGLEVDTGPRFGTDGRDVVEVVGGGGATNVTMTEDNGISEGVVEPGAGGGGGGGGGEESRGEAGLSDRAVSGGEFWLVEDASS